MAAATSAWDASAELRAELDRVGVSLQTAGLADAVVTGALGRTVWIMGALAGPAGIRSWEGSEDDALARLAALPDGAGADSFWQAFS